MWLYSQSLQSFCSPAILVLLDCFNQGHDVFKRRVGLHKVAGTRQKAGRSEFIETLFRFGRDLFRRAEWQDPLVFDSAMEDQPVAILRLDRFAVHSQTDVLDRVEDIDPCLNEAWDQRLGRAVGVEEHLGPVGVRHPPPVFA
jgi:hypothetical protein